MGKYLSCALFIAVTGAAIAQDRLPAGTQITIRTNEAIDGRYPGDGRIYRGIVDRDVLDRSGRVVIPRGGDAELMLREPSRNEVVLDLESIMIDGRRYAVETTEPITGADRRKEGVGANDRTGKYVGGGAILGSIIGAIAGGGKGAAIGAAAGAGAGAAGQTVTRGGSVRLPAESLITFNLERPLTIGGTDTGYVREGHHYHSYESPRWDDRQNNDRRYDRPPDRRP